MSDGSPNVTSHSPERRPSMIKQWWWIPVTFIVPFVAIYEYLGNVAHANLAACFRSGAIGVGVAALVYGLWLIDQKIQNRPKAPIGPLIGMLGMMLWLGWVVSVHVMVIANDDAHYLAESETH
ncbi:hypothetical protein BH10CYA1_BH10CYA1_41400 [soil metagenome]